MSRYSDNYKEIEWGPPRDWRPKQKQTQGPSGPFLMPDITPFQSPINFGEISSRSALREHEKRYGVRQCGELNKPEDYSNASRRTESFDRKRLETAFREALGKHGAL